MTVAVVRVKAVVDGNILNDDFNLYLSITGERTKRIGLGTFSDGVDRARPMLIFANPDFVLYRDTQISRADDLNQIVGIEVKKIERTPQGAVARATGLDQWTGRSDTRNALEVGENIDRQELIERIVLRVPFVTQLEGYGTSTRVEEPLSKPEKRDCGKVSQQVAA